MFICSLTIRNPVRRQKSSYSVNKSCLHVEESDESKFNYYSAFWHSIACALSLIAVAPPPRHSSTGSIQRVFLVVAIDVCLRQ